MVLHHGENHFVALRQQLSVGRSHKIERLGGAASENNLIDRSGINKTADTLAGRLHSRRGLLRKAVHTAVHIRLMRVVDIHYIVHHRTRHLRRGGIVEIDERLAVHLASENRKIAAQCVHIVYFVHCGSSVWFLQAVAQVLQSVSAPERRFSTST